MDDPVTFREYICMRSIFASARFLPEFVLCSILSRGAEWSPVHLFRDRFLPGLKYRDVIQSGYIRT